MDDVREWLKKIKLGEYIEAFEKAGYDDIETIKNLEVEDLKEIGIQKAGHRKKILAMAKRLNEQRRAKANYATQPQVQEKPKASFTCYTETKKPQLPKVHPP
eukprot:TRINITY_DN16167_c0_g1_i25.p3 TRINITY_DN16167_c0_g1~~TRINITY_DN16167_c0_g1_i25.p3  ORF type:complete len:102 (+),score=24.75 TRINITY_DN16167_c0_g1_i25:76-381(+)